MQAKLRPVSVASEYDYNSNYKEGDKLWTPFKTRGYFHRWAEKLSIVRDDKIHAAAVEVYGIVEMEDGTVLENKPWQIKFADRNI